MDNLDSIITQPVLQPEVVSEETDATKTNEELKDENVTEESSPSPEKPKGVQKRIDELTRDKYEARRMAEQQMEINKQLLTQLQALQQPKQQEQPQVPQQNTPPDQSQYQTYEDYVMALSEWKAEQTVAKQIESYQKKQQEMITQRQQEIDAQTQGQTFVEKTAQAQTKYPDFVQVVSNPQLPITPSIIKYMNGAENTADIAYYLGKNPEVAMAIAQKSPDAQEIIIRQIDLHMKTQQKVTQAPDPINPLNGGQGAANDLSKVPMEDFFKIRNQQEYKPPNNRR